MPAKHEVFADFNSLHRNSYYLRGAKILIWTLMISELDTEFIVYISRLN